MLQIELVPDLDHCIETVARREHEAVLKQLLTPGKGNKELEKKLEILRHFLGRVDFRQLRAVSERQIMKGRRVKFVVYLDNGVPKHEMHVM
jgi:hypothetical protein